MAKYVKEMTQKNVYEALSALMAEHPELNITLPGDVVVNATTVSEYLMERAVAVAKKNSGERKLSEKQQKNEEIKAALLALMREKTAENADFKATVTQLFKALMEQGALPDDMTTNRLSALIQLLYKRDGVEDLTMPIHRVVDRRVAYFKLNPDHQAPEAEDTAE